MNSADTMRAAVEALMALVSEYGQCRWSEGSSGATYLDRMGERRSREEAYELFQQIERCATELASIPPNTPEDALRRAGAAGPLGDVEVASPTPCGSCRKPWLCEERGCMDKARSEPAPGGSK